MRTIFPLALILMATTTQAQLKETSASTVPTTIGSFTSPMQMSQGVLISMIKDGDTTYTLKFMLDSHENTKWNIIVFKETGGTLNSLYNILNSFFSKENLKNQNYKRTFNLGGQDVTCTSSRTSNTSIFFKASEGMFYIHEKQLNKLFGR